ncbi:MAG TPA: 20S proteasome subunit A/B [Methylomirabilota bacterium]|nr:20S proteasome subunit A/B [Methylomirabilota bacterium]
MTEEPYRWLEAINNRREYIRDQLKGGTPVFAVSRPEGILLLGVGQGQSKVFEIFDRHGFAALGHPVDIEKIRQSAIEAAHLEGFSRSTADVTLRRLISFALSTSLKNAFEQIFSPPIMVESIFAEVAPEPARDVLVRVHYDGNHHYETSGVLVAHSEQRRETEAADWLRKQLRAEDSISQVAGLCLVVWKALAEERPLAELRRPDMLPVRIEGRTVEAALLDRRVAGPVHYRALDLVDGAA